MRAQNPRHASIRRVQNHLAIAYKTQSRTQTMSLSHSIHTACAAPRAALCDRAASVVASLR